MKKNVFIALLCLVSIIPALSQTYSIPPNLIHYDMKKWHFGFTLGPEFQYLRVDNNSVNVKGMNNVVLPGGEDNENVYYYSEMTNMSTGFHVGIITSRRFNDYFNLRIIPSLSLGQKNITSAYNYDGLVKENNEYIRVVYPNETLNESHSIKSTYMSCPVLLKYKAVRINNFRPYMIGGFNFKYDLATDSEDAITLNEFDMGVEVGLGADFYLPDFRLGVELRFGIGLLNMLDENRPAEDPAPYITASIDQIKARTFTIAFNFE